jgi:hypothetical protein
MVKAGQVRQHNFFGREYISGDEVSRLAKTTRKPGRPRKMETVDKCP